MLKVSYKCIVNATSVIVDQGLIPHFTTNAWLPRLLTKQMFEMTLMIRRNFSLGFLKHVWGSASEITRNNSLIRSIEIALRF